jgi:hypothetical protein
MVFMNDSLEQFTKIIKEMEVFHGASRREGRRVAEKENAISAYLLISSAPIRFFVHMMRTET